MKTFLYEKHRALGANLVDFCGWQMPLHYGSMIEEHRAVRERAALFDVSHMGRIDVLGPDAERVLDFLSTSRIAGKKDFHATYTVWCNASGGSVDDLMVYRRGQESFFVVVNASNREKDLSHIRSKTQGFAVEVTPRFEEAILAFQGPLAQNILSCILEGFTPLDPMHFAPFLFEGEEILVSATGYTGAGGVEIYGPASPLSSLWDRILDEGRDLGVAAAGLGARDTLRLEMGFALYGHELDEEIAPTESVSAWTVKWDKEDFLGKEALLRLEESGRKRHQYGVFLERGAIAREGHPVFSADIPIGKVTSGAFSPTLAAPIALIMVERNLEEGENVAVEIRGKKRLATVTNLGRLTRGRVR